MANMCLCLTLAVGDGGWGELFRHPSTDNQLLKGHAGWAMLRCPSVPQERCDTDSHISFVHENRESIMRGHGQASLLLQSVTSKSHWGYLSYQLNPPTTKISTEALIQRPRQPHPRLPVPRQPADVATQKSPGAVKWAAKVGLPDVRRRYPPAR